MNKEKAIELLKLARKHRERAEKLERIAHRQLDDAERDEHRGIKDEHEVKAAAHVEPSIAAHAHSRISALHNEIAKAAPTGSQNRAKHTVAAVKHLTKAKRLMDKAGVPAAKQTAIHMRHIDAASHKFGGSKPNVGGAIRAINALKEGLRH